MPKDSTAVLLLEGKTDLLRLLQEIPLGEAEQAAVEDGIAGAEAAGEILKASFFVKCLARKLCCVANCRPLSRSFHVQSGYKGSEFLSTWILRSHFCASEETS